MSRMFISYPEGGIIPGSVLGRKDDVPVAAQEPILVPETYGKQMISDRFAVAVDGDVVKANQKAAAAKRAATEKAASDKAAAEKAEADLLAKEKADAISAAEQRVDAALKAAVEAGDDMVKKAEADAALKAAEADLTDLKG